MIRFIVISFGLIKEMTKDENEPDSISSNFKNHTIFLVEIAIRALECIRTSVSSLVFTIFDTTLTTCNKSKMYFFDSLPDFEKR